jgi:hypothetical protein
MKEKSIEITIQIISLPANRRKQFEQSNKNLKFSIIFPSTFNKNEKYLFKQEF